MIEVNKLSKAYGDYKAVNQVSFTAERGEIVGFLGPNGAGKTSTIRMLSTFLPPTSGTAKIAGFDIKKESDQVRRVIGYLPETPPLYEEMSVEEYLYFVARIKGVAGKKLKESVERAAERCFLKDVFRRLCGQLSKGYRQRVGLAQAIVHDPEVVILDEPTSGLDPRQIIDIRTLIKDLGREKTLLLSTHILPEVTMVCSKVVIINRGMIVREGKLSEITRDRTLEQLFLECVSYDKPIENDDAIPPTNSGETKHGAS